jgi:hypothetical protein
MPTSQTGIQLALHYETLNQDQRRQIWKTFITKLEGFQKDTPIERELVNTEDLYDHLDELSDYKMNGWEISNAVTAARQLALFKKEKMNHSHLTLVIEETQKFEGYLL